MVLLGEGVAGHEDNATVQPGPTAHQQKVERIPRDLLQMEIEEHEIDIHLVERRVRQVWIPGGDDLVVQTFECALQRPPDGGLIVDHEDARSVHEAAWWYGVK
jgi:hypothetical protein